jgi:hypothetical protein
MQKELEAIIQTLSNKYGRPKSEIEEIVKSPYYLTAKIMDMGNRKEGKFFNIRIRGLGIFKVCDRVAATIKKMHEYRPDIPTESNYQSYKDLVHKKTIKYRENKKRMEDMQNGE